MFLTRPSGMSSLAFAEAISAFFSITPGASNAEGAWTTVVASTASDCQMLLVWITATSVSTADKNVMLDIGIGGTGNAVDEVLVENLIIGKADTGGFYVRYAFPFSIPAGTRLAMRAQHDQVTVGSVLGCVAYYGTPSRPEMSWVGRKAETIGTVTNSIGQSVASSSAGTFTGNIGAGGGDWVSLGTTTKPINWWEFGFGLSDDTISSSSYYWVELGIGDGSAVTAISRERYVSSNSESIKPYGLKNPMAYYPTPIGATVYARVACSTTPDATPYVLAYGVY